ncbi:2TM domain-containing protein [Chryseobacterium sp. MFBS3-17]|uniref:2TM domain-containing protein n=1 Tax=Chryseobacterium sp. MFBS3-17 TaxID=2886689 RepID=UPI001D0E2018|nr:2TM domain-containing protein [Chryseobacterium sp. MFBS3-17]MCC2591150.1 2TM domain-containing protein [Chryseobacterium sp. MFBS3-17]
MNRKAFQILSIIALVTGTAFFVVFTGTKTPQNWLLCVAISFLYSFPLALGNGYMNQYLNRRYSWTGDTRKRVAWGIAGTVVLNVLLVLGINYVVYILLLKNDSGMFFSGDMAVVNWIMLNVTLLISAILHAKSFMEEWKRSSRKEVVEQKLIARSANAQFESLKNQLDPHFLFNSLNVLSALIDENPDKAQDFTASMSKIYRYVLEEKDKELVTVEAEIDFARTYCELLKTRFEESVNFEFDVAADVQDSFVVPLSLQLLLENCIKHNYATARNPLNIRIYSEGQYLFIENNLQVREQVKESAGIGLSNIVQRYALLTGQHVFIEKSDDFFRVKIPILKEKITAMNPTPIPSNEAYRKAEKRVKELKDFYGNLISYCLFMPFLIFINLKMTPGYHWFWWPVLGWGIGVISHAFQVLRIGRNWEEKQIRKILEKENQNNKYHG